MNQEISILPFKDPSYQKKITSGQNHLPTTTYFSWNFAFRGLDFMEFPLSDQNSKKNTYLRFKGVLLYFYRAH